MQKMHNALGAALRSALARGRELIEKMHEEKIRLNPQLESEIHEAFLTTDGEGVSVDVDVIEGALFAMLPAQDIIRQNLRDSYPIWGKK